MSENPKIENQFAAVSEIHLGSNEVGIRMNAQDGYTQRWTNDNCDQCRKQLVRLTNPDGCPI